MAAASLGGEATMTRAYEAETFQEEKESILEEIDGLAEEYEQLLAADMEGMISARHEEIEEELATCASPEALADEEIALAVVSAFCPRAWLFPTKLCEDKAFMLKAVAGCGKTLSHASEELRADKDIVLAAVGNDGQVLEYASEELQVDKDVVVAAVSNCGWVLENRSPEIRADREVVLAAISNKGTALKWASHELRMDRAVVLAAVRENGDALGHASTELQADREVVLCAVANDGYAIYFASKRLQDDKEIVRAATAQNPMAILERCEEIRSDPEFRSVLLDAVCSPGGLAALSSPFRADREVVLSALSKFGRNLKYAAEELKADRDVVLVAAKSTPEALVHASEELRADEDFILLCARACETDVEASKCLEKAHESVRQARSPELFLKAKSSVLALPGQQNAPVLSVTLTSDMGSTGTSFTAHVTLASGTAFYHQLLASRSERKLGDLAIELLTRVQKHSEGSTHVFTVFLASDDKWVSARAWDCERPVSDFVFQ